MVGLQAVEILMEPAASLAPLRLAALSAVISPVYGSFRKLETTAVLLAHQFREASLVPRTPASTAASRAVSAGASAASAVSAAASAVSAAASAVSAAASAASAASVVLAEA